MLIRVENQLLMLRKQQRVLYKVVFLKHLKKKA